MTSTAAAPLLFVTRKFPPSVGGMETLARNVWEGVHRQDPDALLIAHGGSVKATVGWLPPALVRLTTLVLRRQVGRVLCGDVALYFFVGPLLRWRRVPHAVMAMGLDVTFDNALYRRVVLPGLRKAPMVLAISEATAEAVRAAGVHPDRVEVLTLGIPDPAVTDAQRGSARSALRSSLGLDPDAMVLATVGRLVPRKGVRWFISQVVPSLTQQVHYVIAGDGPDRDAITSEVERLGLHGRVHLLGRVSDTERDRLMEGADVFVQPNVPVAGDMEGFGLVAIEAAMRGALVLAADLEGLTDAVEDGVTGDLAPPQDAEAWVARLDGLLADPPALAERAARYRSACIRRSSLDVMERQLARVLVTR